MLRAEARRVLYQQMVANYERGDQQTGTRVRPNLPPVLSPSHLTAAAAAAAEEAAAEAEEEAAAAAAAAAAALRPLPCRLVRVKSNQRHFRG